MGFHPLDEVAEPLGRRPHRVAGRPILQCSERRALARSRDEARSRHLPHRCAGRPPRRGRAVRRAITSRAGMGVVLSQRGVAFVSRNGSGRPHSALPAARVGRAHPSSAHRAGPSAIAAGTTFRSRSHVRSATSASRVIAAPHTQRPLEGLRGEVLSESRVSRQEQEVLMDTIEMVVRHLGEAPSSGCEPRPRKRKRVHDSYTSPAAISSLRPAPRRSCSHGRACACSKRGAGLRQGQRFLVKAYPTAWPTVQR